MTPYPQLDNDPHPLICLLLRRLPANTSATEAARTLSAITQGLAVLGCSTNTEVLIISLKNPRVLAQNCPAIHNGRIFEARLWLKRVAAWDTNIRSKRFAPLIRLLNNPPYMPYGTN